MTAPTHEQVLENARKTREHTSALLDRLASADINAVKYLDGVRIDVPVYNHPTMYVYVLPWARGWSVFASDSDTELNHTWRGVHLKYTGLQNPVYCPRNKSGPWNVPIHQLESAVRVVVYIIRKLDNARRKRAYKHYWYWPRSVVSLAGSAENTHAA